MNKSYKGYYKLFKALNKEWTRWFFLTCIFLIFIIGFVDITKFLTKWSVKLFSSPIDFLILSNCFNIVDMLGELNVYSVTNRLTNLLMLFSPLSITFYYFIAREQKNLSESSLSLDRKGLKHFFLSLIGLVFYGSILIFLFDVTQKNNMKWTLIFWALCLFFMCLSIRFISYLFKSININYLFERMWQRANFSFETLLLEENDIEFFRKKLYKNLNSLIESIYQMLNQSISKGIISLYESKYRDWEKTLNLIFTIDRKDIKLISKNSSHYTCLYKNILKNQEGLIISLYSNQHISEGYNAVITFFNLVPDGDIHLLSDEKGEVEKEYNKLMKEYLRIICSLGLFFYKSNLILYPLILQIKRMPLQRIGIEEVIPVYRTWIIRAVESSDAKMLMCLSYALIETIEESGEMHIEENNACKQVYSDIGYTEMEKLMSKAINKHLSDPEKSIGKCIYILFNSAVKAMETSQYQNIGFIIKFIVSNFDSKITNPAFEQFIINGGRDSKFDDCDIGNSFGLGSFNLNNKTDKYCLEKLAFLLYGQQFYIKLKNISIKCIPNECIDLKNCIAGNMEYIYKKSVAVKDKYGLVWLTDEVFLEELVSDLMIENIEFN